MATLLQVRDTVALYGRIELQHLCQKVGDSPAMVQAMLERLEQMGWVTKTLLQPPDNDCGQGYCQGCAQGCAQKKTTCAHIIYQIRG